MSDGDCVVCTGALTVRAGQQSDFTLSLHNAGQLPVDRVDLLLSSASPGLHPDILSDLIRWDNASFQGQLPVRPGGTVSVKFCITGVSDCLTAAAAAAPCLPGEEGEWGRGLR